MVTKCFKADLLTSWCGGSIVSGCPCTWVDCLGRSIGFSNRVVPLCFMPGKLKPGQLGLVRHNDLSLLLIGPFSIPMAYGSYSQGDFVHAHSETLSGGCSPRKKAQLQDVIYSLGLVCLSVPILVASIIKISEGTREQ
jgi:hypothetical protein